MVLTTLFFSWYLRQLQLEATTSAVVATTPEPAPEPVATKTSPQDFDQFYERFHLDSAYQLAHIIFPLEGVAARDSSYVASDEPFRWQKEKWILHRPFNDMGGAFTREFARMGADLIIENIKHVNGRYGMQRRYARYDDGWYLIYYAAMNELAVAEAATE